MFRVPVRNITEQYLLVISLKKFLSSFVELKVSVLQLVIEVLVSLNANIPLLVP